MIFSSIIISLTFISLAREERSFSSNLPAINLYTKYGFNSLGTRKGYYQDNNEDALIMWTENIFYEKFKNIYEKNKENLKNLIEIK